MIVKFIKNFRKTSNKIFNKFFSEKKKQHSNSYHKKNKYGEISSNKIVQLKFYDHTYYEDINDI